MGGQDAKRGIGRVQLLHEFDGAFDGFPGFPYIAQHDMGVRIQTQFIAPAENPTDILEGGALFHGVQNTLITRFHTEFDHVTAGFLHQGQHRFVDSGQPAVANPTDFPTAVDDLLTEGLVALFKQGESFVTEEDFLITLIEDEIQFTQDAFSGSDLDDVWVEPWYGTENALAGTTPGSDRNRVGIVFDHRVEVIVIG